MSGIVNNLTELISALKSSTVGKNTEESFEILQQLVGSYIRIRYEIIGGTVNQTTTRGCFAHLNGVDIGRIILTTDRLGADFSSELMRQCNGVVLEYSTWNLLSVPAGMFNPKYKPADAIYNISEYDVYDIKDGTTITLYWYRGDSVDSIDGSWCMSSTNGFDVSNYQWMGESTYFDTLINVAKLYPDFNIETLDKTKSYTIGFRHTEFHPLLTDPPKMWFIQSCNISLANSAGELLVSSTEDIGIPLQTLSELPQLSGKALVSWINDKNSNALKNYMNAVRSGTTPDIHYGFVFRSYINTSDIIIESDLLKKIRNMMYNLPKRQHQNASSITAVNRLEYTILRAYLSSFTKYVFLNLFPQFGETYRKYDDMFGKLTRRIISLLKNRNIRMRGAAGSKRDELSQNMETMAVALSEHIRAHVQINVMDAQGPSIVGDFLMDTKHLDMYYTCLIDVDPVAL